MIPALPTDLLLGLDFVRNFGMDIFGSKDTFTLADRKDQEFAFDLWAVGMSTESIDIASVGLETLTAEERQQVQDLLNGELPPTKIHSKNLGFTHLTEHEMIVNPGTRPIKQKYFRVSEKLEKIMHEELGKLKEQDVVEESNSKWNNPVVMVRKQSGHYIII